LCVNLLSSDGRVGKFQKSYTVVRTVLSFNRIDLHSNAVSNKVIVYLLFHKCVTTANPITRPTFAVDLCIVTDVYDYAKLA